MALGFFRPYQVKADFLSAQALASVRSEIVDSPYLGATTLNERFGTTKGFSVTFTRAGMNNLGKEWPAIHAYLERILDPKCNAFFLNPLVIGEGAHVDAHIDCSLRSWTAPEDPPFPTKVSVLYVEVPRTAGGGDLLIYRAGFPRVVTPKPNLLVEFQGHLRHEVSPVVEKEKAAEETVRISLVCEQYAMPRDLESLIPVFHLNTKRSFDDFLENALEKASAGKDGCA